MRMRIEITDADRQMYDAIWGNWRPGGNSFQRRAKRRARMRRIVFWRKVMERQIEHFFDESPFQRKMRERGAKESM